MKNLWLTSLCFALMLLPSIGSQEAKPIQGISIDPIVEVQDEEHLDTDLPDSQMHPFIPLQQPVQNTDTDEALVDDVVDDRYTPEPHQAPQSGELPEEEFDMDAMIAAYEAEMLARVNANLATMQQSGALDVVRFYMAYATNQLDDEGQALMMQMLGHIESIVIENVFPMIIFGINTPPAVAYANSYDIDVLQMIVAMDAILQLSPRAESLADLIDDSDRYIFDQQEWNAFLALIETLSIRLNQIDPQTMPIQLKGSPLAILLSLLDDIALQGVESAHAKRLIDLFFVGENAEMSETIHAHIATILPIASEILPTMNANIADARRNAIYQDTLHVIDFLGFGDVTLETIYTVLSTVVFDRFMTHLSSIEANLEHSFQLLQSLYMYQDQLWNDFLTEQGVDITTLNPFDDAIYEELGVNFIINRGFDSAITILLGYILIGTYLEPDMYTRYNAYLQQGLGIRELALVSIEGEVTVQEWHAEIQPLVPAIEE
ncbi:hypothetical protein PVA45_08225 (plasmid) [Entomospira entomophila]|uniref:Uncharacterized protein n=1 Tax=Entomospira entomophila TaxID=2719988 RepID=A0A968KTI9_9SPIO|nr:hypothetical protein [Entomospira entomophilus]NIZ41492.1 hypothetical protein [Entomospira entomophilus]WDI36326.1 hypothetical protein PVA45_08225 [Entomospira entomophilus]